MKNRLVHLALYLFAVLASFAVHAAAPPGSWWDPNYGYRRQITIPAGTLATNYALPITFNHAAEVAAGRSLTNGNDVRVVRWTGTAWVDLDRVLDPDSGWSPASTTTIWFRTQTALGPGADDNYYLYYGNAAAGTPLQNGELVFSLYDDFSGSFDTGRWTRSNNTVTVSGGLMTVPGGQQVRSVNTFGTSTIWEAEVRMSTDTPSNPQYYWAANSTGDMNFGNYLRFRANNTVDDTAQVSPGTTSPATANFTDSPANTWQLYSFTREGSGTGRFLYNGTQVATFTGANTGVLRAFMRNEASAAQTQQYEWVRVRPYRNPEPVPTLGALDDNLIAAWHMGEASWNGTVGEVNDSGLFGLDGRAFNGAQTAGGVTGCRYGTFNGTNQYVEVPDNAAFDLTTQLSVSVWIYPRSYGTELKSIVSKDDNYEFHLDNNGQVYWWWNGGGTREIRTTGTAVPLNQWTHIAITYQSGTQRLYVNGVIRGTNNRAEALPVNNLALQIGYDGAGSAQPARYWDGYIDAVQIYGKALTTAQVVAAMNATQPCPMNAHHLAISHDGSGIHCLAEPITVSPHDGSHNPFTTYTELITLNTGASNGDWSLQSGTGTLNNGTANDGIATYQWVSGETSATFLLTYRQGPASINITASSSTITDDNTEGNITWGASGFTLTSAALTNPPTLPITSFAAPQVAGVDFPIHITAYGTTPTDSQCGVIETYTGSKNLKFWSTYVNRASGSRFVSINGIDAATSNPAPAAPSQVVVFNSGRAEVTANYRDAGAISVSVEDDTVSNPVAGIVGATSTFIVRPWSFVVVAPVTRTSDNALNPAASLATDPWFIAAGDPFTVTVRAIEYGGTATPNFGRETTPESVSLQPNLVLPSSGQNPAVAGGFGAFSGGEATGTAFSWAEVGIITLTPRLLDGNYLGAGDVVGTASGNIGRFIPFNFGVTANVPSFAPACPSSGYVYVGQPLTYAVPPVLTLTARARGGAPTQNYQSTLFKLVNGAPTTRSYGTNMQTLIQPAPSVTDPTALTLGNGMGSLTFNAASGLRFDRPTPIAPFTPVLSLSVNIFDTDGVAASTNVNVASTNPYVVTGITSPEQRYGRVAFRNAVGSELLNLPLAMHAEYFFSDAAGFIQNANDSCTTGVTVPIPPLAAYGGNLNMGETCLLDTGQPGVSGFGCSAPGPGGQQFRVQPLAGDFVAILQAPNSTGGIPNTGTVTVTATVPAWLQFNWNASTPALENPSAIATFGIFQGESKRIFQTEK